MFVSCFAACKQLGEDGMIWWTKTGFGYTAVCEVRSRHWLVIGQCGETLVNTRFCAKPRINFSVRRYLVIEFSHGTRTSYGWRLAVERS
jgi:hypothetical protein